MSALDDVAAEIGEHFAALGLSGTAARVVGVLATTPSGSSTAPELAERLGVAKSSMSVALSTLERYGLVIRRLGDGRRERVELADDAFQRVFESKLAELERFPALAERGISATEDPEIRARLGRMGEYYRHLLEGFPALLASWHERDGVDPALPD